MMTTFAVATPHALVLTVSHAHDLLFRQPPSFAAALIPPLLLIELLFSPNVTLIGPIGHAIQWPHCIRYGRRHSPQ
jgi:hypothetical protein